MAAQFTRMKARAIRFDFLWMARAISSLPLPVSPVISTVESVAATLSTSVSTRRKRRRRPDDLLEHRRTVDLFAQRDVLVANSIFGTFAIVDVGGRGIPPHNAAVVIAQGPISDQEPAILAVVAPGSLFVLERFSAFECVTSLLPEALDIFRVKCSSAKVPPRASSALRPVYSRVNWLTYNACPSGVGVRVQPVVRDSIANEELSNATGARREPRADDANRRGGARQKNCTTSEESGQDIAEITQPLRQCSECTDQSTADDARVIA
jgi:hypothetical protein